MRRRCRVARAGALAALLLLGLAACDSGAPPAEADAPARGPVAPPFQLTDLDGRVHSLEALRGRPVVVDFWATWCAPCVRQIPVLNAFATEHPEVPVLGISVDVEGPEVVATFARDHQIAYPVLLGDEGIAREFGALGFPALFVVAPDGHIALSHLGLIRPEALREAVEASARP